MSRTTFVDFDKNNPLNDKAYHIYKHVGKGETDQGRLSRIRANYLSKLIVDADGNIYIPFDLKNSKHKEAAKIFANVTTDRLDFLVDRIISGEEKTVSQPVQPETVVVQPELDMSEIESTIARMVQTEASKLKELIPKNGSNQQCVNQLELERIIAEIVPRMVQDAIKQNGVAQGSLGLPQVESASTSFDSSNPHIDFDDLDIL